MVNILNKPLAKPRFRYPVLTETWSLHPVAQATVSARIKPFNAEKFFQNRPGLEVHHTFAKRFDLKARKTVTPTLKRFYVALLLKRKINDNDICKELPKSHLSTLEDIAGLIEAQSGGKAGFLLNNGKANLSYVEGKNGEVVTVMFSWQSFHDRWIISDQEPDYKDIPWFADCQVLCPGRFAL